MNMAGAEGLNGGKLKNSIDVVHKFKFSRQKAPQ